MTNDGSRLFAAMYGSRAQIWNVSSGKPVAAPYALFGDAAAFKLSPDGRTAITSDWSLKAQLWDTVNGKRQGASWDHAVREDTIMDPAFDPKGDLIATRSSLNAARVWNAKTGQPLTKALPHKWTVNALQFSPDGRFLLTESFQAVHIWEARTGKLICGPLSNSTTYGGATFSGDGRRAATCAKDNRVRIWHIESGRLLGKPLVHGATPRSVRFGADDVVLTRAGAQAFFWFGAGTETPRKQLLQHGSDERSSQVLSAEFLADGKRAVTFSLEAIAVWRVGQEKPIWRRELKLDPRKRHYNIRMTISDNGRFLLVHERDGESIVIDANSGDAVAKDTGAITASISNSLFATGGKAGAKLWRLPASK